MALDPRLSARMGKWFANSVGAPNPAPSTGTGLLADAAPTPSTPKSGSTTGGILNSPDPVTSPAPSRATGPAARNPGTALTAAAPATAATSTTTTAQPAPKAPAAPAPTQTVTAPATTTTQPVDGPAGRGTTTPPLQPPGGRAPPEDTGSPISRRAPPVAETSEERAARAAAANAARDAGKPPKGGVTTLDAEDLTKRTANEDATVEGRMGGLLSDNSDYVQGFRDRAQRQAASRGLLNSTMAAQAGEEAAAAGALDIAKQDATYFGSIDEYNTALKNQAALFNADASNTMSLAQLQAATQKQVALASYAAQIASAEISAATSRYNAQLQTNASMYATDKQSQNAADERAWKTFEGEKDRAGSLDRQNKGNHDALVNNILTNPELPPAIRQQLLRQLGENDLADAIMVNVDADLDIDGDWRGGGRQPAPGRAGIVDPDNSGG